MTRFSIESINSFSQKRFEAAFGPVFEKSPWIACQAWERRPFAGFADLLEKLCAVPEAAGPEARLALIRAHPDLAGRLAQQGALTPESAREQAGAGLAGLDRAALDRFNDCNARYRERFDFPFIICARLHSVETILASFAERLPNPREVELERAWQEVRKIAALRLRDLVEE
jgi:2-oxo-4-hydroxy-4-carboxy-5-ureidoimidazoline decarboxylase